MDAKMIGKIFTEACKANTHAVKAFDTIRLAVYTGDETDSSRAILAAAGATLDALNTLIKECNAAD